MLATLLLIGFTRWRRLLYLWGPLIIAGRSVPQRVNFDPYLHLDHHVDLPYCSLSNIFHGTWTYKEYNDDVPLITTWSQMISSSFETCPGTLETVKSSPTRLERQPLFYSCDPSQIKPAQFIPHNCRIMQEHIAAHKLSRKMQQIQTGTDYYRPLQVVFLGDSIGGQLLVALDCLLIEKNFTHLMDITYIWENYFREDMPCDDKCTLLNEDGANFRKSQMGVELDNKCEHCPDGVRHSIAEFEHNSAWKLKIPRNTDCLILNSGAWYFWLAKLNSTLRYEETIRMVIVPALIELKRARSNLQVYWLNLPPFVGNLTHGIIADRLIHRFKDQFSRFGFSMPSGVAQEPISLCRDICGMPNSDTFLANATEFDKLFFNRACGRCIFTDTYDWHLMHEKDQIAENYLSAIGVHFLNTRPALLPRKIVDPMVSVDGLHWW
jgi:hypothetical protein